MIDASKIRKYTSENEDFAIDWFNRNGFDGRVVHQRISETLFEVSKDGVTDTFRLTATYQDRRKCNIELYMEQFRKSFEMKCEIERLKSQLAR